MTMFILYMAWKCLSNALIVAKLQKLKPHIIVNEISKGSLTDIHIYKTGWTG